jgi:hypothetical protein
MNEARQAIQMKKRQGLNKQKRQRIEMTKPEASSAELIRAVDTAEPGRGMLIPALVPH